MKKPLVLVATALLVVLVIGYAQMRPSAEVAYPEGYRDWGHVKSMVILEAHPLYEAFGGIHHIYANEPALKALKSGARTFPDGSVLVFDLLEAVMDSTAITEGARKVVGVMEKDSRRFGNTGGWGFEGFKGDTRERVVTDPVTACFNCHASQKDRDYVFSTYRK